MARFLFLFALTAVLTGCATYEDPFTGPRQTRIREQQHRIEGQLSTWPQSARGTEPAWAREWAGSYRWQGSMAGGGLTVSPNGEVVQTFGACLGGCADHGWVTDHRNDELVIRWDASSRHELPWPTRLVMVRWGECRLLVAKSGMIEFVNYVNRVGLPGDPAKNDDEWHRTLRRNPQGVAGSPELPHPWSKLLRKDILSAKIVRSHIDPTKPELGRKIWSALATFDAGADAGLYKGLKLYERGDYVGCGITLEYVDEHFSIGRFELWGSTDNLPKPGEIFTNRGCDDRPAREPEGS